MGQFWVRLAEVKAGGGWHAKEGEFLLSWLSSLFSYFDYNMAAFAGGCTSLVAHGSYYGRLNGAFKSALIAPETSERIWNVSILGDLRSKECHLQTEMPLSTKRKLKFNLFLLCVALHTPLNIYSTVSILSFSYFSPSSFVHFSFLIPDYKGVPSSNARAAARPCRMHKFHPVSISHPWCHRLLHLQGLITGLHGESHAGSPGLSWRRLHHCASFPHQYWDVPGHESQVILVMTW